MKILNLVYPDKSDITYKVSNFPDGQQNIVIEEVSLRKAAGTLPCKYECDCVNPANYPYQIKSHLNNFRDLELIICAVASLRELGVEEIHLYTPYIMGARSDRKFEEGGNNYLKDVICPIINLLNFKTVTCIDPHSDVLEACIKGFRKESNERLIKWGIARCYDHILKASGTSDKRIDLVDDRYILVSPDAGASHKIYKLAEQIGYKGDIITCSKDRDENGRLTKCVVPLSKKLLLSHPSKDYIIIDDICDGGATFINIAKEIQNEINIWNDEEGFVDKITSKIYLIVTHGIFSKGLEVLFEYFDGIYCTNSYDQFTIDTEDPLNQRFKQLNVF